MSPSKERVKESELKYTPTADRLCSRISSILHVRKGSIFPQTMWAAIGVDESRKIELFRQLEQEFEVAIYREDWPDMPTVWDLLRYLEGHDSWRRVPARMPHSGAWQWGVVCVSGGCQFPRHVRLREEAGSNKKS